MTSGGQGAEWPPSSAGVAMGSPVSNGPMSIRPRPALWRPLLPILGLLLFVGALLLWLPRGQATLPPGLHARPLPASVVQAGPRFQRLDAQATGIAFENVLRPEHRFQYLTNGAGLAVGDYDRDGLPDLYLCCQDGPNRLYRQVAPLRFEDVTIAAGNVSGGEAWHTGACFVDIDGDGWLDLYTCALESPNRLYRNRGDGTFEECAARFGLDFTGATMMAAFADIDRDGDLDCYLLTNRVLHPDLRTLPEVLRGMQPPNDTQKRILDMVPDPRIPLGKDPQTGEPVIPPELQEHFLLFRGKGFMAGQRDRLLRQENGVFRDATDTAGIHGHGMGLGVAFWDYDQDGLPDLYVANDLESPDQLWHNQGDGTFREVAKDVLPHIAYYGMGCDAADVDNDGRVDLLVADMAATTHFKAKVLMGDMNRQREVLMYSQPQQIMRNALFRNTGTGRCQEVAIQAGVASTDWTWSVLFGDLDNDGHQDLFATNGIPRFDMDPDVELRRQALLAQGKDDEARALIRAIPPQQEKHQALRNLGGLRFQRFGAEWGLDHEGVSHGAVLTDLDRDGDLDVVVNHWNEPLGIYQNTGAEAHRLLVELRAPGGNPFAVGARVEAHCALGTLVREVFPARGYLSGSEPVLHFGLGDCAAVDRLLVVWPDGRRAEFRDVAADQHLTIVQDPDGPVAAPEAPAPALLQPLADAPRFAHRERDLGEFEYQREPLLPRGLSRLGPGLAVADVDGDGKDDLWNGGAAGQSGALWLSKGGWRAVAGPWQQDAACEDLGALLFDADGDGDIDLYVVSGGVEAETGSAELQDRLYRNQGDGTFQKATDALPDLRESGSAVAAVDFDRDGDLDLAIGGRIVPGKYPDAPPSRLLRNDGGRFTDVTAELAPALLQAGMVSSLGWADVDDDGLPDLLLAVEWGPVRILRNDQGRRLVDATEAMGLGDCLGWWNSVLAVDVDQDGDLDLVAGNAGRNHKYKADPEHPTALYVGDFDGNGSCDLIEAKYEGDRLLPVRGRSCSSQAMPHLAQKFPTYRSFAQSVLGEIYPQEDLAKARVLQANCLESVLWRNDGAGKFTREALPWLAQSAPVYGLVSVPLGQDGALHVLGAQNSSAPEPETGRMAGGLGFVLREGTTWVEPRQSGLVLADDGRAAVVGDFDGNGRPDVALARSGGDLQVLGSSGAPGLRVRLHGLPGNPTAIGARVTVTAGDGRQMVAEVTAGHGYLSQSTARIWLAGSGWERIDVRWPDGKVTGLPLPVPLPVDGLPEGLELTAPR